jgi:hypothetical protein
LEKQYQSITVKDKGKVPIYMWRSDILKEGNWNDNMSSIRRNVQGYAESKTNSNFCLAFQELLCRFLGRKQLFQPRQFTNMTHLQRKQALSICRFMLCRLLVFCELFKKKSIFTQLSKFKSPEESLSTPPSF